MLYINQSEGAELGLALIRRSLHLFANGRGPDSALGDCNSSPGSVFTRACAKAATDLGLDGATQTVSLMMRSGNLPGRSHCFTVTIYQTNTGCREVITVEFMACDGQLSRLDGVS